MKKLIALLMILILAPVWGFCQELSVPVVVPGLELSECFASLAALSGLVIIITQFVRKDLKISGNFAQYLSWLVSVILAFVGFALKLGIFEGLIWWQTALYGVGAGLISNGIFDIQTVKALLNLVIKIQGKEGI